MSEQSAIDTYGDQLFGSGTQAALDALGKTYELAFMKGLSQLVVLGRYHRRPHRSDRCGARDRQLQDLPGDRPDPGRAAPERDRSADVQAVLKQLCSEFSQFADDAGTRIINASAFHDENTTVERAIAEIFLASDDFVQDLLAPTPRRRLVRPRDRGRGQGCAGLG